MKTTKSLTISKPINKSGFGDVSFISVPLANSIRSLWRLVTEWPYSFLPFCCP
ncbi:hypothetical protein E2C01_073208 [Portunus trituberculatus]|uniref:Uncharacterized protein n=1 Tax=Portunus trituberculatus TaxID=210409 RepID=A0A5B7I061_PORTR|nr:hypothetical protein [Portunus trituberculatus]